MWHNIYFFCCTLNHVVFKTDKNSTVHAKIVFINTNNIKVTDEQMTFPEPLLWQGKDAMVTKLDGWSLKSVRMWSEKDKIWLPPVIFKIWKTLQAEKIVNVSRFNMRSQVRILWEWTILFSNHATKRGKKSNWILKIPQWIQGRFCVYTYWIPTPEYGPPT